MSKVSGLTISLNVSVNQLVLADCESPVRLDHKCAGAFLQRALIAAHEGRAVVLGEAEALWRSGENPGSAAVLAPDRTAIKRLVEAVEAALAQLPAGTARLEYAPRTKTVGPWRLVSAPHVHWHVEGLTADAAAPAAFDAAELPCLLAEPAQEPKQLAHMLEAVNQFALAEDALRRGQYEDGAHIWRGMLADLQLSGAAQALVGLRLVRALRRAGQFEAARLALKQAALHARGTPGRAGDSLRAECALVAARLKFDVARTEAVRDLDFHQLWQHAEKSLSPALQAQWANLHALVVRRRLLAAHEAKASLAERAALHRLQLALYEAALFWLLEDGDAYTLQAVVINLANFLNGVRVWLALEGLPQRDWVGASLHAFALGHSLLDRFDLPQDSAWDFIMLAELYMGNPDIRAWLAETPLSWPNQQSPAHEGFYRKSIDVAVACGDKRQLIVAWDQLARWWRWHQPNPHACASAVEQVQVLLQQDAKLAEDLRKDGFVPTCVADDGFLPHSGESGNPDGSGE